jgi:hypothetical protein
MNEDFPLVVAMFRRLKYFFLRDGQSCFYRLSGSLKVRDTEKRDLCYEIGISGPPLQKKR